MVFKMIKNGSFFVMHELSGMFRGLLCFRHEFVSYATKSGFFKKNFCLFKTLGSLPSFCCKALKKFGVRSTFWWDIYTTLWDSSFIDVLFSNSWFISEKKIKLKGSYLLMHDR